MEILLLILMFVFSMTMLAALCSIVVPIKSLGFESRKEAGKAAVGGLLVFLIVGGIHSAISTSDDNSNGTNKETVRVGVETETSNDTTSAKTQDEEQSVSQETTEPEVDDSWKASAVEAIINEPQIVEAMFPNNSNKSFWASMRDDGSRRDGYAEYICLTLREAGMPNGQFVVIRIWDAYAMANGEFKEIGKYNCQLR